MSASQTTRAGAMLLDLALLGVTDEVEGLPTSVTHHGPAKRTYGEHILAGGVSPSEECDAVGDLDNFSSGESVEVSLAAPSVGGASVDAHTRCVALCAVWLAEDGSRLTP